MRKTESLTNKQLKEYCKRTKIPESWFIEINNILIANGFDNYHLRENHAVPELIVFITEILRGDK